MEETKEYLDKVGLAHYTAGMKKLIDEAEPASIPEERIHQLVDKVMEEWEDEVVVLEEADYDGFDEVIPGVYVRDFEFPLVSGETYRVVWGTQEFTLQAAEIEQYVYIGNASIASMGDDTGEPFAVAMGDGVTTVITNEIGSSYHCGIFQKLSDDDTGAGPEVDAGSGLPGITEADEGKVLQVVGGVWTAVDDTQRVTDIVNTVLEDALNGEY